MRLTIIVPMLNEEKTIEKVLETLAILIIPDVEKEIIVVDDGSTDNSRQKVKDLRLKIQDLKFIEHPKNQGKGAAIRSALEIATGDAVIIQDADLEYTPNDFPILLKALENPAVDAVFGSRNLKPERRGYKHYILGVRVLTDFTNLLYGSRLTDVYTCYKLIRTNLIRSLNLESRGFEFEAEVTAKLLKKKSTVVEVPIHYFPRSFAEGKKIRFKDGLKGLWTLFKYWF